jgi:transcriptional regulator with GAF, ATPase, and Fis domain
MSVELTASLLEVAMRIGALEREPGLDARVVAAQGWAWLGAAETALELAEVLLSDAEFGGDALAAAEGLAVLAKIDAQRGDLERALGRWDEAGTRMLAQARKGRAAEVLCDAAEALLDRDGPADVSAAAARLASARALFAEAAPQDSPIRLRVLLDRARAATGDVDGALRSLTASAALSGDGTTRWQAYQHHGALARLHELAGQELAARRSWERATEVAEEIATQLPKALRATFFAEPSRALARARSSGRSEARAVGSDLSRDGRWLRLLEITKRLASERDVARLLERITDSAVELSGAERGFVLVLDEHGKLVPHAVRDAAQPDDPHVAFSQSIAEAVLIDGEPIVTVDARADGRVNDYMSVHRLMLQSVACLPIRVGRLGEPAITLGVLYVENRVRRGRFGEGDVELLLAFADQAAIALANARMLTEIQSQNAELAQQRDHLAAAQSEIERLLSTTTEERDRARDELGRAREALSQKSRMGIIGQSEGIRRVLGVIERVRDVSIPVVIHGESGTGKELVARAIHFAGARKKAPFVALNCAAVPETLLESELFGHEKGAFTGADRARIGVFAQADGGTLFLDEIGDMPAKMQVELLRVLADGKVRPVGSEVERQVDVRVVAASNKSLRDLVKQGLFREDLFYRLAVVELTIPPLRERRGDVAVLSEHLLGQIAEREGKPKKRLSPRALARLSAASFPGNVRQLEHVLMNACVMTDAAVIDASHLTLEDGFVFSEEDLELDEALEPDEELSSHPDEPGAHELPENVEAWKTEERRRILEALEAVSWNRVKAAQKLNMPRRTFYRRLKEYGILAS